MMNFDDSPMLVIWEMTQACDLACRHCRASARPDRASGELSTAETFQVLDQIRALGNPLVILTGGDPLKRRTYSRSLNEVWLWVSVPPSHRALRPCSRQALSASSKTAVYRAWR